MLESQKEGLKATTEENDLLLLYPFESLNPSPSIPIQSQPSTLALTRSHQFRSLETLYWLRISNLYITFTTLKAFETKILANYFSHTYNWHLFLFAEN